MSAERPQAGDDRALMKRCFAHERSAWDAFVHRFARLIYSVVHATLRRHGGGRDEDLVDELFHATFLALYDHNYRKLRQWNERCSLASWIRLVTSSVVVDQLRRRRPTSSIDTAGTDAGPVPDYLVDPARPPFELLAEAERAMRVRLALRALAPADRELLLLLFRDERAPAEVAELLEIKPGALYTRKNRALQRLREALERLPEGATEAGAEGLEREISAARPSLGSNGRARPPDAPTGRTEGDDGQPRRQ